MNLEYVDIKHPNWPDVHVTVNRVGPLALVHVKTIRDNVLEHGTLLHMDRFMLRTLIEKLEIADSELSTFIEGMNHEAKMRKEQGR